MLFIGNFLSLGMYIFRCKCLFVTKQGTNNSSEQTKLFALFQRFFFQFQVIFTQVNENPFLLKILFHLGKQQIFPYNKIIYTFSYLHFVQTFNIYTKMKHIYPSKHSR